MTIIDKNTINLILSWIKWTSGIVGALFVLFASISVKKVHPISIGDLAKKI